MCGITGFWSLAPLHDQDDDVLRRMVGTLKHRGPDSQSVLLDRERGLAMGHTRLSIIDLATGDQPLWGPGQRSVLTVNGELYDYKTIRARLACDGATFATKSDSEIALHLYERRGLEFVGDLRGEFAFALFDRPRDRLVLVRDRFGIKPLYIHVGSDVLIWGSEIKALLAHPALEPRLDSRAVLHQMMQTMVPGTTAFSGVRAVLPGTMLVIERRGDRFEIDERQYWDAEFPDAAEHDVGTDAEPHVLAVRDGLIDAVRVRLEADVPVGAYLSGGIDSCSILGLATPMQQSHVKAFTIAFDHADYDESRIATEMARATNADQELLRLSGRDLYGASFERVVWHAERTFYNTLAVAKWHMSRRVNACGYKVVVTGEGADELFGGYPALKRDMLLHATSEAERRSLLRDLERSNRVFRGAILAETATRHVAFDDIVGFTPSWIQPWISALEEVRPLLAEPLREELADYDPIAAIAQSFDASRLRGRHPLDKAQYTWIKTMLEGQILTWGGDRVDMAHSMESRPAFLDHHLAETAFRVPPRLRIRGNTEKWVLREAMRHVLPRVLYERQKFAFMAPPSHTDGMKREAAADLVARHLSRDRVAEAGLFDGKRVEDFVARTAREQDPTRAVRDDIILNHLLGLQILHHQFIDGAPPPTVPQRPVPTPA